MLVAARNALREFTSAVIRVVMIFLVLSIGLDSMTRIYYSYMPISTWMKFAGVDVVQHQDEPYVIINRQSMSPTVSTFHRTLLILWPDNRRTCTVSTTVVTDDTDTTTVSSPLDRMLSANCPDAVGKGSTNAILQVSYLFDFPYGVKRMVVRYSPKFSLSYDGTNYKVGPPLSDTALATGSPR